MVSLFFSMLFSFPKALFKKPDWIIVQYPPLALPLMAVILSKLSGAKLIFNASDLWSFALGDLGVSQSKSLLVRILRKYENWLVRQSTFSLGQSQEIVDYLKKQAPDKEILLYRTGVNTNVFQARDSVCMSQPLRIVYTGVIGLAHNLLEVCKNIDFQEIGAELHIYGDGLEKSAIKFLLEEGKCKGVFLHESVSNAEVAQILPRYDAVLVSQSAYIYGTLPSKTYEAIAVGLPILFHGKGEGARLVERNRLGFVSSPQDWEKLRNNIRQLIEMDKSTLEGMSKKSRKLAEAEFSRAKIIQRLIERLSIFSK